MPDKYRKKMRLQNKYPVTGKIEFGVIRGLQNGIIRRAKSTIAKAIVGLYGNECLGIFVKIFYGLCQRTVNISDIILIILIIYVWINCYF